MSYVDGFVLPVPEKNLADYKRMLAGLEERALPQTEAERAHAGRYSTAQAVIAETALVDFLET